MSTRTVRGYYSAVFARAGGTFVCDSLRRRRLPARLAPASVQRCVIKQFPFRRYCALSLSLGLSDEIEQFSFYDFLICVFITRYIQSVRRYRYLITFFL